MAQRLHIISNLAIVAAMSACGQSSETHFAFKREAGALIDTSSFGAANRSNMAYMTGEQQWTYDLSQRFSSEVMTTVNFAFNSAILDGGARDTLREQARWIRQFPEVRFRVYGHTDKVGSDRYNKSLGLQRAHAVVNYLNSQGISRSRLEAVVSFGERQPLIVTEGRERRNRRTVTEVSGFVPGHTNVLDGNYAQVVYREYVRSAEPASGLSSDAASSVGDSVGDS
ncbi:MAG: OmpA family protein [Marinovum sp.]|nr:OmpA family protein [Marinovum sp.]